MEVPVIPQVAQVVLDTTNPSKSAEFWRRLLELIYREGHEPPKADQDDPAGRDWLNLLTSSGEPILAFQYVEALPRSTWPDSGVPQQLHLDLTVRSLEELMSAQARVLELGGELRLDHSDRAEEPLLVFTDPDGHPFCIFVRHQD